MVLQPQWDFAELFYDGKAKVKANGEWALIDTKGKYIIAPERHWNGELRHTMINGRFNFHTDSGLRGFINDEGKVLIAAIYDKNCDNIMMASGRISTPHMTVTRQGKFGIIDESGREMIPCVYDQLSEQGKYTSSSGSGEPNDSLTYVIVKRDGKYGLVDTGNRVKIPIIYYRLGYKSFTSSNIALWDIEWLHRGLLHGTVGNQHSIISETNKTLVTSECDSAAMGKFGQYLGIYIKKNGKWGFIDTSGTFNVPCTMDNLPDQVPWISTTVPDSLYAVQISLQNSIYSKSGQVIAKTEFEGIDFDKNGNATGWKGWFRAPYEPSFAHLNPRTFKKKGRWKKYKATPTPEYEFLPPKSPITHRPAHENVLINNQSGEVKTFKKDNISFYVRTYFSQTTAFNTFYVVLGRYNDTGKWLNAVVDTGLRYILRPQALYDVIGGDVFEHTFIVKKDGRYGVVDSNLRIICPFRQLPILAVVHYASKMYLFAEEDKTAIKGFDYFDLPEKYITVLDSAGTQIEAFKNRILGSYRQPLGPDGRKMPFVGTMEYNEQGKWVPSTNPDVRENGKKKSGYCFVVSDSTNKMAILRIDGKSVFPALAFRYAKLSPLGHGYFIADSGKLVDTDNNHLLKGLCFEHYHATYDATPPKDRLTRLTYYIGINKEPFFMCMSDKGMIYANIPDCK